LLMEKFDLFIKYGDDRDSPEVAYLTGSKWGDNFHANKKE
jgi:hypothetical protein